MTSRKTQNLSLTKDETASIDALAAMRGGNRTGQIRLMLRKEIEALSADDAARFNAELARLKTDA